MSNHQMKDEVKYTNIMKNYSEKLITLEEACKAENVTIRTYYNICKRLGKSPNIKPPNKPKPIEKLIEEPIDENKDNKKGEMIRCEICKGKYLLVNKKIHDRSKIHKIMLERELEILNEDK